MFSRVNDSVEEDYSEEDDYSDEEENSDDDDILDYTEMANYIVIITGYTNRLINSDQLIVKPEFKFCKNWDEWLKYWNEESESSYLYVDDSQPEYFDEGNESSFQERLICLTTGICIGHDRKETYKFNDIESEIFIDNFKEFSGSVVFGSSKRTFDIIDAIMYAKCLPTDFCRWFDPERPFSVEFKENNGFKATEIAMMMKHP